MMTMINNLGNRMVTLMRVVNLDLKYWSQNDRKYEESRPQTKFDHELRGMTMALKAMDIPFEFEYDSDVVEMTAVIIMGVRFPV